MSSTATFVSRIPGATFWARGGIWWLVAALIALGIVAVPQFGTAENITNLLRQSSALAIVAIGQTIVVLAGGIDLSVGALMGLVAVVANGTMQGSVEAIPLAVGISLAIGLAVGAFNGLMVVATRINPLILTFGMLSILQGLVFVYTDRTIGSAPPEFQSLSYGTFLNLPNSAWLAVALGLAMWLVLALTPFGRYLAALGSNRTNARRAGVPTRAITIAAYTLSGLFASIAGLVLAARIGTGYTLAGLGFEIDSIVAVVLGGTALTGGRGGLVGTFGGLLLLSLISNLLNLLSVSAYVQQMVKGLIVVAAVVAAARFSRSGKAWS